MWERRYCAGEDIVQKITALQVVTGNVDVGSLPTINVGQVEGGVVEKFHSPEGANGSA